MNVGWTWLGLMLLATTIGQLLFKSASVKQSARLTVAAILIFCAAPPASFMALHTLSLATVYVSTAIAQLLVVISSLLLFRERYSFRQWTSLALILAGVLIFNSNAFL